MITISKEEEARINELINRRTKQLIVHSYLYYRLNESVILDHTFDSWCKELVSLGRKYPDIAAQTKYWEIGSQFDDAGTGFFINQYPTELILDAEILIYGFNGNKR